MDTIDYYVNALSSPFSLAEELPDMREVPADGPSVLVFAPHPDDECIIGLLPLVMKRELHARVINVAVTLGSNPDRQEPRKAELEKACACLGFELEILGLRSLSPTTRKNDPQRWTAMATRVATLISDSRAEVIFLPHAGDYHPAHIATSLLVEDAYQMLPAEHSLTRVYTEFWHPMPNPNLMVECSKTNLGLLLKALSCHHGEIVRNPYHLRLPAWMIDNTRRGAEVIGGTGATAPDMHFSTLYRWHPADDKDNLLNRLKETKLFRG